MCIRDRSTNNKNASTPDDNEGGENEEQRTAGDKDSDAPPPIYYDESTEPFEVKKYRRECSRAMVFILHLSTICSTAAVSLYLAKKNQNVKGEHVHGIKDLPFIWTSDLNNWFREDDSRRNALLITSQGLLDILTLWSMYRFCRYSQSFRVLICLSIFYSVRACLQ